MLNQLILFLSKPPLMRMIAVLLIIVAASTSSFADIEVDKAGNPFEYTYATMSDGVKIALAIGYPRGFDPKDKTQKFPAVFEMSGYPWQTLPAPHAPYAGRYVTVNVSLRGSGASEGKFSLYSERSTQDGYEIIEDWIVKQPWSNGKVGIHGHSWSGLTGIRVAATNPPHLNAVVVSGLFDDVARGLAFIGGIPNIGFPTQWTSNFENPDGVFGSDKAAAKNRKLSKTEIEKLRDMRIRENSAIDELPTAEDITELITLRSLAAKIRAPIFISHAYQDEQTGPSGVWLFDHIQEDVPKRLLISNGHHGMPIYFIPTRRAWFDFWLRDESSNRFSNIDDPASRVEVYFDVQNRMGNHGKPLVSSDFPLPETQWTRFFLNSDGMLSTTPSAKQDGSTKDTYDVKADVADEDLDGLDYRLVFDEPTAICGPITVTLWASATILDTDLFAVVSDVAPDGRVRPLQRGMLRASLRTVDEEMSSFADVKGEKVLIRPHHTLVDPQPLVPDKLYRYDIEVFPVGHVFRAGHQLSVSISQPPMNDPTPYITMSKEYKSSRYEYESNPPPGTVTIHRAADYPSSILVPVLPMLPTLSEQIPDSIDRLWTQLKNEGGPAAGVLEP